MLWKKIKTYLLFAIAVSGFGWVAPMAMADTVPVGYTPDSGPVGSPSPFNGRDPSFAFQYISNSKDGTTVAVGILSATDNGGGVYTATSGSGTVTSTSGGYNGPIVLFPPNPTPPGEVYSPSGYFLYDDQLLPSQNPVITNGGLLFEGGGLEINIFSNGPGPGTYQFYENNGFNDLGNFTLTAVPLPASAGVGFGMLGIFGSWSMLRKRLSRRDRIA